jgi:hypothetical protein
MVHGIFYGIAIFVDFFTHEWLLLLAMPFVGRLFFDTALNLFRHKGLFYVSPDAKAPHPVKGASVLDWYEWHLFKSGLWPKVVYLIILIILLIINYEY